MFMFLFGCMQLVEAVVLEIKKQAQLHHHPLKQRNVKLCIRTYSLCRRADGTLGPDTRVVKVVPTRTLSVISKSVRLVEIVLFI